MLDKIRKILRFLFAPVAANPLFFAAIVILGLSSLAASVVHTGFFPKTLTLYAVVQGAVYAYLLSWVVYLFDKAWLKGVLVGIWGICGMVEWVHFGLLDHVVDLQSLSLMLDANSNEVSGFFHQFFDLRTSLCVVGAFLAIVALAVIIGRTKVRITRHVSVLSLLLIVLLACGIVRIIRIVPVLAIEDIDEFTIWMSQEGKHPPVPVIYQLEIADPVSKYMFLGKGIALEKKVYDKWKHLQPQFYAANDAVSVSSSADSLQVVVIIGESFIKSHSSLYGYHLPVNPRLETERNNGALVVFTDMISAGNYTNMSIANLLNLNRLNSRDAGHRNWWENVYFPLVFKKAGWQVCLFTNQYDPQSRSSDLGRIYFDPFIVSACYDAYNKSQTQYDDGFVAEMIKENRLSELSAAPRLTIWHLKGQHFPAVERFPENPALVRFSAEDIPADKPWLDDGKRQLVADYANATLYNDSVVGSIIDLYRDKDAVVVYFSDHGEEMWDTAPAGNRNKQQPEDPAWMHRQFDIPFVVWMSESFRGKYPDMADSIRGAADRPGTLDNLGQMLLQISGIESGYLRPDESIISGSYRPGRRISAQGYLYPGD